MKISSYSINGPMKGVCKQWCVLVQEYGKNYTTPLIYLQRPKWITDDEDWERVVKSLKITLPSGSNIG